MALVKNFPFLFLSLSLNSQLSTIIDPACLCLWSWRLELTTSTKHFSESAGTFFLTPSIMFSPEIHHSNCISATFVSCVCLERSTFKRVLNSHLQLGLLISLETSMYFLKYNTSWISGFFSQLGALLIPYILHFYLKGI